MFTYIGRSKIALKRGATSTTADAVLWQENPKGGGTPRYFFVRPVDDKHYHLRIIVGSVITTDRDQVGRGEVNRAAKLMGIMVADSYWSEVEALR